jgi:UDP-N-acetylmuramoylalanine--D-glutamate ligase
MITVTIFAGRKVAVFGLGLSGIASAEALAAGGAEVHVWDDGEKGLAAARAAGLTVTDLRADDWRGLAALILAPGVPLTHPEPHWTVRRAAEAGVEVIGDTELFCRQRRELGSLARIAAITGTNGKSTTTALTAHLLTSAGRRTAIGGNFGTAVLALDPFADDMHYVIEYSSFQIDLTPTFDASVACLLNVTADHIDRHGSLEHYAEVKERIFARLGQSDTAVIGVDDAISAGIAARHAAGPARLRRISAHEAVQDGVYAQNGRLIEVADGAALPPVSVSGIGSLRGAHNWQNAAAVFAMTRALGLSREEIAAGLKTFPGLAHRMEEVGRLGRVLFINDSKATNADAAGKALASFDSIYWIAGGLPKEGGLAGLEGFMPRVRRAYLIGAAADDFAHYLDGRAASETCGTLDAAVAAAARDAAASGDREPVVLLSPACASYDQFPNFTARGDAFKALVAGLKGVSLKEAEAA